MYIAEALEYEKGEEMSSAKPNGRDLENVLPIPQPIGKIFDARGQTVKPPPTAMARLDLKASEKVELSRGTLWLMATGLVLAGVVFSYGSSMLAWARDDESQRVKMTNIERQVEEMRNEVKALSTAIQEQRVKDAETRGKELGYSVGRADKQTRH